MRYLFTTIFLVISVLSGTTGQALSQVSNFADGFEDGDFTSEPAWSGDTNDFAVTKNALNKLLQLDATSSGPSYLSTSSTLINGIWQFYIEFQGFEPSGSNQANIFLMSNTSNLEGPVNGYAVQVGESGDDVFKIVRFDNGTEGITIISDTTVIDDKGGGYTVKVTRSNSGDWHMEVGKGYGGPLYDSGNIGTDNTYPTASYFGPKIKFSSSRSDKFSFDFKIDLPPFTITNAKADSAQIDVSFNRAYDQSTVEAADFIIDHSLGSPQSVSFPSSTVVRLKYGRTLASKEYLVSAQNIQDENGNNITTSASASFINFDTYVPGDVIINEFLYDPPGEQAEYVELKNRSEKFLNLQNWQLGDNTSNRTISTDTLTLRPHSFLVISSDTSALFRTYGSRPYVKSNIRGLNNSGDVIKIISNDGSRGDSLQFKDSWGGEKVALERRSDTAPSVYRENFGVSPNTLGGTPGTANEIPDDTAPPKLSSFIVTDNQTVDLHFSERLNDSNAADITNYSLNNEIPINSALQTAGNRVQLILSSPLQNGTPYQLTIDNQKDIFGNTSGLIDSSFTYYEPTPADSGNIFINEFMYDPPSGSNEYIELYNPTSESFDLNGWTLSDNRDTRERIINTPFIVPPDSFAVIAPDSSLLVSTPGITLISMSNSFPSLNDNGDAIVLRNTTGVLLDSLNYNTSWSNAEVALERRTIEVAPFQPNFGDAPNGFGTPGRKNQIPQDIRPPNLENLTITGNQILELNFSEHLVNTDATNTDNYSLDNDISISNAYQIAGDSVRLRLSSPLENGVHYQLTINNQEDIFGNTTDKMDSTFTYYKISSTDSGDVFINEFTYDPPSGSTEYIELYNPTSASFDLNEWTLNDNSGDPKTVIDSRFVIPPDSFVVIAPDKTLLNDHPDIALIDMASRFPSLNNSGDNIILHDSSGVLLDSLNYDSNWNGAKVALERRTINVTPIRANFGDAPNGFGTPGSTNEIPPDSQPPHIADFSIISNQSLEFIFTEAINRQAATDADNYRISGNLTIHSVRSIGQDTLRINLSGPLQNDTEYTVSVDGINDFFGNTLTNRDTTFTYYEISSADSVDVFINEFMYDPPSGQTEYIEFRNRSDKSLSLQNWTINDNTGKQRIITPNRYIIPPDSFVVIAPDNTLLTDNPAIPLLQMGNRFPSFNNSGDDVVLRDSTGQLLDSLRYTSAWDGHKVALERRSTRISPFKANFGEAPNGFGTPGMANHIPPDTTSPGFSAFRILDESTIQLTFSENISGEMATDISNYSLTPDRNIRLISAISDTVTLFLSQPLQSGQSYRLTVKKLQDLFGNTIDKTTKEVTYVKISKARRGDIIINEILYTRKKADDPEFMELFNHSDKNIDLFGWTFGDASDSITLGRDIQLPAGGYLVLTDNASLGSVLKNGLYLSNFPSLNDNGDALYIKNNQGAIIDSLFYNPDFGGISDGKSAERKDPLGFSNDASNFATSTADDGSTPGVQNSVFMPDVSPPRIVSSKLLTRGTIQVKFSEFISSPKDATFSLNEQRLSIASFDPDNANIILLNAPANISTETELNIKAENLTDARNNATASTQIAVAQRLQPDDVDINEILYNPLNDSDDNRSDQSEYIELRNTRKYTISLEGITLHDAADEDGKVRTIEPVNTTGKYISPQGTALIYAEDETPLFKQSRIAQFFDFQDIEKNTFIRVDRSTLSLASSDDAIYLTAKNGSEIDSVFYNESWQNQNLVDTKGIALERISPTGPSNDASNWGSSTSKKGGTPNQENSIYQESGQVKQEDIGISFTPNPFSPDGDGTDDRLFINYKLDRADYLITVHIYDRYGRLVRELADGKPAGFTGSLIWDGLKGNGTRNRIGIYIVIFKAFDGTDGKDKAFKKTVVLARRLN